MTLFCLDANIGKFRIRIELRDWVRRINHWSWSTCWF